MAVYEQQTGRLLSGALELPCYAGAGTGKNNPAMQDVHDIGPLPCGWYTMLPPVNTTTHGPNVIWLQPDPGNEMFGRSAFGIHSDSVHHPGQASEGCIIDLSERRLEVWASGDHRLHVVSGALSAAQGGSGA